MKQIKVTPQKARVKGNLIPNLNEMENPPNYEDFHVSHQKLQETTYQGVTKDVIRLSPKGEKLYLGVTSDVSTIHPGETATITCTAYYKNGNTNISLSGQTIYVYHNNSQVKTLISDEEGQVTYEFTTTVEGKHNISFKTLYSNGFDPANGSKDIVVYTKTALTLNPKTIVIGHDEYTTLSGKLSTNSGVGLAGKPVILMEGAERTLATVITKEDGTYTYNYIESTNRGTPTVLTATEVPTLIQNTYNNIIGYLKTENGTPISGQKVRLYYGYNAYERCHAITDSNGKYILRYKPTDTIEREHYIIFCSTVDNTSNNQYQTYEPSFLSIGNMKAYKSPELTITNTTLTTTVNEPITINLQIKDTSDSKITFNGEKVLVQYSSDNNIWVDLQQVNITNNKANVSFNKSTSGTYYIRFTYNGNTDYTGGISSTKTITVNTETIDLSTNLPNNATCHLIDNYPITTTMTNSKGNPVAGEVIKYYLNSETSANLMGTATTNSNGIASLTWNANPPNILAGNYTVITKHEGNLSYEAKTVTNSLKIVKRTRQFAVTSGDAVQVNRTYYLEGEVTYTTHFTNYLLRVNNHDITMETEGLIQQPLLLDDFIQDDLLSTTTSTNVAPSITQDGYLNVGQKGTVYYKYPITIAEGLNVTYEFKLQLDTGSNDGRLALLRLGDQGNLIGYYDYWLPKSTYGENPSFRLHFVDNIVTITEVNSGTLIRERELSTSGSSTYYIGFLASTAGKVIIERISNTLQPLTKYPIANLNNWYHDTYPNVDESTQTVQDAYIGDNGYVFQGIRKGFVLKRPIDFEKDTYIRVETYQKEVWMRVGFTTLNNNDVINTNRYQYTYVNQIGLATADLSNFSVFKYEFRVQRDGTVKAFINGTYTKTITFNSNETPYLCIYATSTNDYVKDVVIRQDTIHLKTSNGYFITEITPAMVGEYVFKFTVETMDAYYALHREKTLYSIDKEFPEIELDDGLVVMRNQNELIYASVPEDAFNQFILKLYDPDDNEYIHETGIENAGGYLEIDTVFNYPKGYYTYSIEYLGDDYYAPLETPRKSIEIRDEMEITCNNEVGGVITAPAKSTLTLTGHVINSIGEAYNGSLTLALDGLGRSSCTVTEGNYTLTIDLNEGFVPVSTGNHTIRIAGGDDYFSLEQYYTLNVTKLNTTILGSNTGIIKNTNSLPRWQCQVPKDFNGKIYVYLVDSQGNYITGSASTSIVTSTNGISSSDLHKDTIENNNNSVNVWWEGKWDSNNTTQVNMLKNTVGVYTIKYVLVNDSTYNTANSLATYYLRQPATITTDTDIRQFENENAVINIRAYDTLGNAMTGTITAKVGSDTPTTVQITNGTGTYTLPASKRKYSTTNHITTVNFTYKYSESGYWSGCNNTVTAKTYNVKTNTYGIFMNSGESVSFDNNSYLKLKNLGITDLYVRANQEVGSYSYMQGLLHLISYLEQTNHRNEFRIHAVFNCVGNGSTWYLENNQVSQQRINDLKTHMSVLLQQNVDGICFDYIRRGSRTPDDSFEPDISNLVTELSDYVKENTPNKTIMISACVVPEYEIAKTNYGQNYEVFEDVCDYIIPMIYLYDYSSRNETTPRNSSGYLWQQKVVQGIFSRSGSRNKVMPCITTYKGDSNVSTLIDKEDMLYQIRSMWNYGLPDNKLQQSAVLFRDGLIPSDCLTWKEVYNPDDDDLKIEIEPVITKKTLNKATEKIQITWRNKWGGHVGELGTGIIKINGVTQDVEVPVRSGTNITLDFDLSVFRTGQNDVQIVFSGSKTYHTMGGRWNDVITLQ